MWYINYNAKTVSVDQFICVLYEKYDDMLNDPYSYTNRGALLDSTGTSLECISHTIHKIAPYDRISVDWFWELVYNLADCYVHLDVRSK